MRHSILLLCVPVLLAFKSDKPAYVIHSADGKKVTYSKMLKELAGFDVIFFGELHNDPIAHWLQLELAVSLHETRGSSLKVGAEMFETDNQLIIDEYLSGTIRETNFEAEVKLWNNYKTDYKPLMLFAKNNNLRYIATNVPRRYAAMVSAGGFEALEKLTAESKALIPPMPFDYDPELKCYKDMLSMGGGAMGTHVNTNLPKAQALKDVTMAWKIATNYNTGELFLHLNGSYHSNRHEGIVWYLKRYRPELKIAVINLVLEKDPSQLSEENKGTAEFVIAVPATMTRTY
ncbi:MAG: ChaN family lipoprotein [Bacteroidetes bacterium]|nr:ChaN family lipoprotein [Bacteroidota bacterium]